MGVEENEIAGLGVPCQPHRQPDFALAARQQFPNSVPEHYLHESAAIQSRIGAITMAVIDPD